MITVEWQVDFPVSQEKARDSVANYDRGPAPNNATLAIAQTALQLGAVPLATNKAKTSASARLGPSKLRAMFGLCLAACATGHADPRLAPLGTKGEEDRLRAMLPPEDDHWDAPHFPSQGFLLPNGLRVRVEVGSTNGTVGSVLTISTGSSGDPVGKEGLAHLVEHLVFHQPGSHPGVSQTDELVRLGARYNEETSADATTFYEFAPAAALASLCSVTSRRLADALGMVDNNAFLHEKAIVTSELFQRGESRVFGTIVGWMQAALFPSTPYARPVGGDAPALSRIALVDARDFAKAHYSPKNATLLLIGPPSLSDFAARVRRLLDPANAARPESNLAGVSPSEASELRWAMGPVPRVVRPPDSLAAAVPLPALWVVYKLPSLYGKDGALCRVLTGGAAARVRAHLLADADVENVELHVLPFANATIAAWEITLADSQRRTKLIACAAPPPQQTTPWRRL